MKSWIVPTLLAVTLSLSGCYLHPPYGGINDTTTLIPPMAKLTHRNNLPPAQMLMEPGPGVGGPGPGIIEPAEPMMPPGAGTGGATSQVAFTSPEGMAVSWDVGEPGTFDSEPLIVPGPLQLSARQHLSAQADEHPRTPGRRAVPDAGDWSAHAAHRGVPGAQRDSRAVHRRRFRPGALGQLRDQGHLFARSRVSGIGARRC